MSIDQEPGCLGDCQDLSIRSQQRTAGEELAAVPPGRPRYNDTSISRLRTLIDPRGHAPEAELSRLHSTPGFCVTAYPVGQSKAAQTNSAARLPSFPARFASGTQDAANAPFF